MKRNDTLIAPGKKKEKKKPKANVFRVDDTRVDVEATILAKSRSEREKIKEWSLKQKRKASWLTLAHSLRALYCFCCLL